MDLRSRVTQHAVQYGNSNLPLPRDLNWVPTSVNIAQMRNMARKAS